MINITVLLLFVWAHFIGDFILQSDYHALNKSKSNMVLFDHVVNYIFPFAVVGVFIFQSAVALALWVTINLALHAVTDYVTSRITSKLWLANKRHWFFVTIGADQSIHFSCLFLTYIWLQ